METVWVLAGAYETPKDAIAAVIEGLLRARKRVVENAEAGRKAGCDETVTFDRRAAGRLMRVLA